MSESNQWATKLVNGRIPANTVCPFREQCSVAIQGHCHHRGEDHTVSFSCGFARALDLTDRSESEPKAVKTKPKGKTVAYKLYCVLKVVDENGEVVDTRGLPPKWHKGMGVLESCTTLLNTIDVRHAHETLNRVHDVVKALPGITDKDPVK